MRTASIVNVTEQLLSLHTSFARSNPWALIRPDVTPLLPCPVPFQLSNADLTGAVVAYQRSQLRRARQVIRQIRAGCSASSVEQWYLTLIAGMLCVEQANPEEAWHLLQLGLSWRNEQEHSIPAVTPREWLAMATIALAVEKFDTAEAYASEAVGRMEKHPVCCVGDLLSDTRADAMTVFAAIRLAQQKFHEAEMLLQLSHDAFVQVGDMEQLVVGMILLADVETYSGSLLAARYLLCESDRTLIEECDPSRHHRVSRMKTVVHERLQLTRAVKRRPVRRTSMN